jgi:5-methylcytosine-specific restriction protein A
MNTYSILRALIREFGIKLELREENLPDGTKIILRPTDFYDSKGFNVVSKIQWLSLRSELVFENYSGGLLNTIAAQYQHRIGILEDNLRAYLVKFPTGPLHAEYDNIPLIKTGSFNDLSRLSIYCDTEYINPNDKAPEEYIIEHQQTILSFALLLFDIEEITYTVEEDSYGLSEGSVHRVEINKYERSRLNRKICIDFHGTKCKICGFDFYHTYGELGKGFIHVHHIKPVSEIGPDYKINPIRDLIPVCPNCHAMIHRSSDTLEVDEILKIIKRG